MNIILDPILIFVFDLGVKGAALATIISQAVSAVWVVAFLAGKKTGIRLKKKYFKIDFKVLAPCIGLGVSPFIMQATESVITVSYTHLDPNAEIIFGTTLNEELDDKVIVTVIATGLDSNGIVNESLAKKEEPAVEEKPAEEKKSETEEKAASQPDVVSYIDNDGEKVDLDIEMCIRDRFHI